MHNSPWIGALGLFILGCILLLLRKPYARQIINFQNSFFGFRFGNKDVRNSEWVIAVIGGILILVGLIVAFEDM